MGSVLQVTDEGLAGGGAQGNGPTQTRFVRFDDDRAIICGNVGEL